MDDKTKKKEDEKGKDEEAKLRRISHKDKGKVRVEKEVERSFRLMTSFLFFKEPGKRNPSFLGGGN
jgi:hypothetical protein